jgi:hypothetical protein
VRGGHTWDQLTECRVGRYYDPATSQFLSIDPLVGVTDQPYAFTADDPLNFSDPLGLLRSSGDGQECGGGPDPACNDGNTGAPAAVPPTATGDNGSGSWGGSPSPSSGNGGNCDSACQADWAAERAFQAAEVKSYWAAYDAFHPTQDLFPPKFGVAPPIPPFLPQDSIPSAQGPDSLALQSGGTPGSDAILGFLSGAAHVFVDGAACIAFGAAGFVAFSPGFVTAAAGAVGGCAVGVAAIESTYSDEPTEVPELP